MTKLGGDFLSLISDELVERKVRVRGVKMALGWLFSLLSRNVGKR